MPDGDRHRAATGMVRLAVLLAGWLLAGATAAETTAADTLDALLRAHVRAGRCDLAGVKADPRLPATLELLAKAPEPVSAAAKDERSEAAAITAVRLAHYLNAYTAFVLSELCAHWPVTRVTEIDGFHSRATHVLSGRSRTLDELVEQSIRPLGDPRVYTALLVGPRSGPPWRAEAYRPETVDSQLDQQAAAALARPDWVRLDVAGRRLELAHLFRWYAVDFEPVGGPAGFVAKHLPAETDRAWCAAGGYRVEWLPFDWAVGDAP